jgi:hypothetical protein
MRITSSAVLLGLLAYIAPGQVSIPSAPGSLKPQAKGHIVWSKKVGRLDSRDSHAVVTALIVEGSPQLPTQNRGVRIDFSWADQHRTIYIDEGLLQPEKKIFDDLTRDIGRSPLRGGTGWAFLGSCEFRDHPDTYPLVADYNYSGPYAPALRIIGPEGESIMFQGLMPRDLSKVLGDAIEELKAH